MPPEKFGMLAPMLLIAWLVPLSAQEPGSAAYTISDNVNLVVLDVSVSKPRGGYVRGLSKDDFQVFEDGHSRVITQFGTADMPVTVGLVVDNSGSMRGKRKEVILAGLGFAKESNSKDEFFVVNFNNSVVPGLPERTLFTDDLKALRDALYFGQPRGQTALYDAVAYSLRRLEFSSQERRALIVVSDGGDNVSTIKLPDLMRMIAASRATVYTVGLYDPESNDLNPGVLRRFANLSGGEYFEPNMNDVMPVFARISEDIRNRYTLAFVPDEVNDRRVMHSIKVTARENGRKLLVRTRSSFTTLPASPLMARGRQSHQAPKEQ
jgi:VWFA-related protein